MATYRFSSRINRQLRYTSTSSHNAWTVFFDKRLDQYEKNSPSEEDLHKVVGWDDTKYNVWVDCKPFAISAFTKK